MCLYGLGFRCKYYFLWYLVDSINNSCGLGFRGYDQVGQAKWDLVTNIDVFKIELGPNIRTLSTYWHAMAGLWIRRLDISIFVAMLVSELRQSVLVKVKLQ